MKKLIVLLGVVAFGLCAVAQDNKMQNNKTEKKMVSKMDDKVMMKDGKMWVMKDGKTSEMTSVMTMKNGWKVMVDGTVEKKDGTKMNMKDGESMDMNGKMLPMKKQMGHMDDKKVEKK